jgi:hypothetical protein
MRAHRPGCRAALTAAFVVLGFFGAAGQRQQATLVASQTSLPPRDARPVPLVGTAAIKGRVVSEATGSPVVRARVQLRGSNLPVPPTSMLTDDRGAFTFTNLPAGTYSISVTKAAYLPGQYPVSSRSMRNAARPLIVKDGQIVEAVTVSLAAGSAIAGRVTDAYGDPLEGAEVRALRLPRSGEGRPATRGRSWNTNDLGEFRIAHLEPGSYFLQVVPQRRFAGDAPDTPIEPAPAFYPGVLALDQAQPIVIERGQSVTGLEMVVPEARMAVVTGSVIDAKGDLVSQAMLSVRALHTDIQGGGWSTFGSVARPDGTFRLNLAPGEYILEARANPRSASGPVQHNQQQTGTVRLSVAGEVISGVTIAMGEGAKVFGRVVFEGTSPMPPNVAQMRAMLVTGEDAPNCNVGASEIKPDGTFTIEGLTGTCVVRATLSGISGWTIKAVLYRGEDMLDRPITLQPGQVFRDVQVVLTDRRTEVALQVVDERGQPTREYVAIVFPVDKARRTRFVRSFVPRPLELGSGQTPGADPRLGGAPAAGDVIAGLPPGEYYAVALDDADPEDVRDIGFLERLVSDALRISLIEGVTVDAPLRRISLPGR